MECKSKTKYRKNILLVLTFIFLFASVSALSITPISTPNGTTSNRSVQIEYNISASEGLSQIKWSWNNTNYSLYDDSLVLFYNFDNRSSLGENDTEVKDLSRYGNNGTVFGKTNVTFSPGRYGNAINFSGNTNYIQVTNTDNLLNLTTSFTVSFWMNLNNIYDSERIINKGDIIAGTPALGFECAIGSGIRAGKLDCLINNQSGSTNLQRVVSTNNLTVGVWSYYVFSYNGSLLSLYKDNVLQEQNTVLFNSFLNTNNLRIGSRSNALSQFMNGSMDNLFIYNRSLTSSEIYQLYSSQINKYDIQNWTFQTNQSVSRNSTGIIYPYGLCASNFSLNEVCSSQSSIIGVPSLSTITSSYVTSNGTIRSDFYGVTSDPGFFGQQAGISGILIDSNNDGVAELRADYSWNRAALLASGIKTVRVDPQIDVVYSNSSNGNLNFTGNLNKTLDFIAWANANNIQVSLILNGVPSWLANITSECNSDNSSCSPLNNTKWALIVNDTIDRLSNHSQYQNVRGELWNEPYSIHLLGNLNDVTGFTRRLTVYSSMVGTTYPIVKSSFPWFRVGVSLGHFGYGTSDYDHIDMNQISSSINNTIDYPVVHFYRDADFVDRFNLKYAQLLGNLSRYNINSSFIDLNEWNVYSSLTKNQTDTSLYTSQLGTGYSTYLNLAPNVLVSGFFNWQSIYHYNRSNHGVQRWEMVSEPSLDNILYPPYSVTSNFTRLCPAGGSVYQSSTDDSLIKTVSCEKLDGTKTLIVINTDTEARNLTSSVPTSLYGFTSSDGQTFLANNGQIDLGVLDGYEVMYLSEVTQEVIVQELVCNNTTNRIGYNLIMIFSSLAIVSFALYYGFKDGVFQMDMSRLLIMFIGIIVGVILWQTTGQNLGVSCGAIG